MKILKNKLKNKLNIRTEKNFPKEGIEFIDIMPLIIQKETFSEIIEKFVEEGIVIIATGPLTSDDLSKNIMSFLGQDSLYFYDAYNDALRFHRFPFFHRSEE